MSTEAKVAKAAAHMKRANFKLVLNNTLTVNSLTKTLTIIINNRNQKEKPL